MWQLRLCYKSPNPNFKNHPLTKLESALSESLFVELNPFNIRVLLVEPGAFRTNFIGSHKLPAAGMTKDYEGTPLAAAMGFFDGFAGKQPGDPTKAVQRVLEVIQHCKEWDRARKSCFVCRSALTVSHAC